MVKVIFSYDEASAKWVPTVEGAVSATEAGQAFNAVILTCHDLQKVLLSRKIVHHLQDTSYLVIPAVARVDLA